MEHDFVIQIRNILPESVCDELINLFERSEHKRRLDNGGYPNWTNLFLKHPYPDVQKDLDGIIIQLTEEYAQVLEPYSLHFDRSQFKIEGCNIKKYVGGSNDVYKRHADVSSLDCSRRYLAFVFYLNDDFTGGETVFYPDRVVTPMKGSVLIFPPYWMFPHEGKPVIEGNKYIMSSYCLWP